MHITMIGHSTILIESAGQRILTDPYFGERGNPAYGRPAPPAKTRADLRDVDVVLISHNHWDHTDRRFLRMLGEDAPVCCPSWAQWMTRMGGARSVVGLRTWEETRIGTLTVTAVPAVHIAVTAGYVIESDGQCVYFAGDTYYHPFMAEIGRRFRLDVALMPVTTFRIPMTMGEKPAVRAVRDLRPSVVIPIHLGIQPRTPLLRTSDTVEGFTERVHKERLDTKVVMLEEGETWSA